MIDINPKLLEVIRNSTCFGIAYDPSAPECSKLCDVQAQCRLKVEGQKVETPKTRQQKPAPVSTPSEPKQPTVKKDNKPAASKPSTPAAKPKPSTPPSGDLPNFKEMTQEQLEELAKSKSVEWRDYGDPNITRMRLIMNLKKAY